MELKIERFTEEELKQSLPNSFQAWDEDRFQIMLTATEEASVYRLHLESFEIMGPTKHGADDRWTVATLLGGVCWPMRKGWMDGFEKDIKYMYDRFVDEYHRRLEEEQTSRG